MQTDKLVETRSLDLVGSGSQKLVGSGPQFEELVDAVVVASPECSLLYCTWTQEPKLGKIMTEDGCFRISGMDWTGMVE